jgi:hypothetical protein
MVRGWQKRVEEADARRKESKQRKQRQDDRRVHKHLVHELLTMLEKFGDSIIKKQHFIFHIWTDFIPGDQLLIRDAVEAGNGRNRSRCIGDSGRKGLTRSDSLSETPSSKKKAHARSKEAMTESAVEESALVIPQLCRNNFFGKCGDDRGKKSSCRYEHYSGRYVSLSTVLNNKSRTPSEVQETLSLSEAASPSISSEPGAMPMVSYFSIDLKPRSSEDSQRKSVSELLSEAVANSKASGLGSIVYVAMNDFLLFDRYRNGMVVSENTFLTSLLGTDIRPRGLSIASDGEGGDGDLVLHLPGQVLEYILMFLPDSAVACASMVCHAWHADIGKVSPSLWRFLLKRRSWPMPEEPDPVLAQEDWTHISCKLYRDEFVSHYESVRDIRAVQLAMSAIVTKRHVNELEMSFQSFASRRGAPQPQNCCVAIHIWSKNRILAAYAHDCSLRLYMAVSRTGLSSDEKRCRELACLNIDPFKNIKRRTCDLVAMALDADYIGCLCHITTTDDIGMDNSYIPILTVVHRDDFLLCDSSAVEGGGTSELEEGALRSIDVKEAVLNYLVGCEEGDHRILQLRDFLAEGDDNIQMVEIIASQSIASCDNGRFLLEVSVSLPVFAGEPLVDDNDPVPITLLFRKLVLFSASTGSITWIGDSDPLTETVPPRHEKITLSSIRTVHPGRSRTGCSVAVAFSTSPTVMTGEIDSTGCVQSFHLQESSGVFSSEASLEEGWNFRPIHHRPMVITPSAIVAADTFVRVLNENKKEFRSIVSFFPRHLGDAFGTLVIEGKCEVIRLTRVRSRHVILLCRVHAPKNGAEDELGEVDGQWLGNNSGHAMLYAIIVDVSSHREIERVCLLEYVSPELDPSSLQVIPIMLGAHGDTVGVGFGGIGVAMTGHDVRTASEGIGKQAHDESATKTAKRRKKGKPKGVKKGVLPRGKHT